MEEIFFCPETSGGKDGHWKTHEGLQSEYHGCLSIIVVYNDDT